MSAPSKSSSKNSTSSKCQFSSSSNASSRSSVDLQQTRGVSARIKPEGGVHPSCISRVYDCCAYVIHCAAHNRVLIARQTTEGGGVGVWLPFTQLTPNGAWKESAMVGFCLILAGGTMDEPEAVIKFNQLKSRPPFAKFKCYQVFRVQLPQTQKFLTRLMCYFKLAPDKAAGGFRCCQKLAPHLDWLPLGDLESEKLQQQALGPELMEFVKKATSNKVVPVRERRTQVAEYSIEEALHYVPREPPRNIQEEMLMSLRITEKDVARLYADFLEHVLPSFYQTPTSFAAYLRKHRLVDSTHDKTGPNCPLARFFVAANTSNSGALSFHEFLLGLGCMDPNIVHAEMRARFVFRYYDTDKSGTLSESELEPLYADMHPEVKDPKRLKANVHQIMSQLTAGRAEGKGSTSRKRELSLASFINAVGSHQFRGTSTLCRLTKSIFGQISRMMAMRNLRYHTEQAARVSLPNVLIKRNHEGTCAGCQVKKYELASHQVTFDFSGNLESKLLPHKDSDDLNTKSDHKTDKKEEKQVKADDSAPDTRTSHQYSIECVFNPNSAANKVIELVREFNPNKGNTAEPNGLLEDNLTLLCELLESISNDMFTLLEFEDKCQRVYSPCFVMGDIHGNLEDLLSLERSVWKQMPVVGSNYLFLGDYVDRGKWGLECALYLCAFKILCPNKVTMLRGNHEVRQLQQQYSYKRECFIKYGDSYGSRIWNLTNRIFDKLPVSAILDDAIYCAHGGIPRSAEDIATINRIVHDLPNPERQSKAAWEILWSDPCPMHQFESAAETYDRTGNAVSSGFLYNYRRGTAFLFNERGATKFLSRNGLTHIIRAHEVAPNGYVFNFSSNQCVTIFSTSHYCGNENESACIFADNQRLRLIVPDTTNNASATDLPID